MVRNFPKPSELSYNQYFNNFTGAAGLPPNHTNTLGTFKTVNNRRQPLQPRAGAPQTLLAAPVAAGALAGNHESPETGEEPPASEAERAEHDQPGSGVLRRGHAAVALGDGRRALQHFAPNVALHAPARAPQTRADRPGRTRRRKVQEARLERHAER